MERQRPAVSHATRRSVGSARARDRRRNRHHHRTLHHRRHFRRRLHRADLRAGRRIRAAQRQHSQDRRAYRRRLHRAAEKRVSPRARTTGRLTEDPAALTHPFSTVRDLLRFAVSRFNQAGLAFGHGSANAYDEAAYLVLHTLHLPLDLLDPFLDARLAPAEIDAVLNVIERRATDRIPAAYLTKEAWMHGY